MRSANVVRLALALGSSCVLQACITLEAPKAVIVPPPPASLAPQSQGNHQRQVPDPQAAAKAAASAAALVEQANQYARDGLYREAISAFKKYLVDNPKDAGAHRTLGIIYVKTGAYKLSLTHFLEALPNFPDNFELNYYVAEAYRTQNRYADAIYHYKRALQTDPKSMPALKALTWSYYSIRYYAEALKSSRQLKKLEPNDFQVSIIQARIMNKIGMNDKALTILNKAEALSTPDEVAYLFSVKGDIYLDQGESEKAEQAYRRALQDQPLLPGALTGLAKKMLNEDRGRELAITYLERAVRVRPSHYEAFYLLGRAYEKTDSKKANEYYRQFYKEASYDPLFQREVAQLRSRFSDDEKKKGLEAAAPPTRAEDLEDQL